jgi:hypothetical protein
VSLIPQPPIGIRSLTSATCDYSGLQQHTCVLPS